VIGGYDAATALAGVGESVPHEVDAAALPAGMQHLGDRRLDPLMGIRDHELDAAKPAACELAQERGPERLGFGGPMSMPRTSRRPSPLTPTATITATETMRPFWRTFT
jgi:hypothetical protein